MIELIIIVIIIGTGFFFQKKYKPTTSKDTTIAYILWFLSIFGLLGFHRHYLGKYGSGCLWMFTCGCFGIGAFVDLLTLKNQVNNHNTTLNKNPFPINKNVNTQLKFQTTTYNQTTARQIKPLTSSNAPKEGPQIKQNFADDIIKTINRAQTDLHSIEVIAESTTISVSGKSYSIKSQPEDRKDTLSKSSVMDNASSAVVENAYKEIGSVIQSLTDYKKSNTIEQVSEIPEDDSVIDVTDQVYTIETETDIIKPNNYKVPYWKHQYVYSYSELEHATSSQKEFYTIFKSNFINGVYLDLEGNNNYAFILLFDILNEFDLHKNISVLKSELEKIGLHYSKTKSYANRFLVNKLNEAGHYDEALNLQEKNSEYYYNKSIDYDTFDWRDKYKKALSLSDIDIKLLNKIWYPNNNFINIEYCCKEVIRLYISTISLLKEQFKTEGITLEEEFLNIADLIARKHYRYRSGSQNYKYSIDPSVNELYNTIFKYCENIVREAYGHKRKLNTVLKYTHDEITTAFENKVVLKLNTILTTLITSITPPDETTELQLNTQNTVRWKSKFLEITANFSGTAKDFVEAITVLGNANKNNPSVENIFYEGSKFIAKYNKESALILYVHYLHHDLKSSSFDNKQLTKTIQKNLFSTNDQLNAFQQIISQLINDKDLTKALESIPNVYAVKRKKIKLDRTAIKEARQQHSGTVELLNEYLRDDFEDDNNTIKAEEISTDEIQIEITQKTETVHNSIYLNELPFTNDHIFVLELFAKNSLSILQNEMETFAKSKGRLKNQIIENINEICYEVLDDILIEEDDDYYTILPEYYNKIKAL